MTHPQVMALVFTVLFSALVGHLAAILTKILA